MLEVIINGKNEKIEQSSILNYIQGKGLNKESIVVELNGNIITREDLDKTIINNNDKIEIIRFVGGG